MTLSRDAADNALAKALADHAEAHDLFPGDLEEHMLNTWACIVHWQKIDADGTSTYTTHTPGNNTPTHVAAGLHGVAIDLIHNREPE